MKIKTSLLVSFVVLSVCVSVRQAAGQELGLPPTTSRSESTVTLGSTEMQHLRLLSVGDVHKLSSGTAGTSRAWVTPVLGPSLQSASFNQFASKLINDAVAKTINMAPHTVTSPTDYTVLSNGKISPSNLILSTVEHTWAATLHPPAPFDQEYGQLLLLLVQAESKTGADNISLAMVAVGGSDNLNVLNNTLTFRVADDYGVYAIGIKADGTVVGNGPSTQLVSRVIFITRMKMFNGGDTQRGIDQATSWIVQVNLTLTYYARIIGDPDSYSAVTLSLTGYANNRPTMSISNLSSIVLSGAENRLYILQSAPAIEGPWQNTGLTITGNGSVPFQPTNNTGFFRVVGQ